MEDFSLFDGSSEMPWEGADFPGGGAAAASGTDMMAVGAPRMAMLTAAAAGNRPPSPSRKRSCDRDREEEEVRELMGGAAAAAAAASAMPVHAVKEARAVPETKISDDVRICALFLESADEMQCRFAVKHDMRETNQKTPFVQANGYIEYRARYSRKRGQNTGYGSLHVAFVPAAKTLFPFYRTSDGIRSAVPDTSKLIAIGDICVEEVERVEIFVRLYQSFRGSYPARVVSFGPEEVYHPLFIKAWQEPTLLQAKASQDMYPGLIARPDPDGEFLRYIVQDPAALRDLVTAGGISFPCPIPAHPERLNDVGMLRMQVSIRFFLTNSRSVDAQQRLRRLNNRDEFDVWVKMKVVQQLSGQKLRFASMLRDDASPWSLPPRPLVVPSALPPAATARHALGEEPFREKMAVDLLQSLADQVTRMAMITGPAAKLPSVHAAAACGNVGVLRLLLQCNVSLVHLKAVTGRTPCHAAAEAGQTLAVRVLVECGALLTALDDMRLNPAQLAAVNGHPALSKFISDLQAQEDHGHSTSICRAAATGRVSALKRMIHNKCDMNEPNVEGFSPLWLAVLHNHPLCVHALMTAGADMRVRDHKGDTLLHHAAERGYTEVVVLIAHHDPSAVLFTAPDGTTPLHRAAGKGHVLCANVLISCGADLGARDAEGRTAADFATFRSQPGTHLVITSESSLPSEPLSVAETGGSLHNAARVGELALARKLLAQGHSVLERDSNGDTPIKLASQYGQVLVLDEIISSLLSRGPLPPETVAAVNCPGNDGDTPLHAAVGCGSIGCMLVMLSSGIANIHACAAGGNTPLHRCAELGLPILTAFLMLHGASPSAVNSHGRTPLDLAMGLGHVATAQVLQSSSADLFSLAQSIDARPVRSASSSPTPREGEQRFSLDSLSDVLRSIWHSTHHVRNIAAKCRTIPISN